MSRNRFKPLAPVGLGIISLILAVGAGPAGVAGAQPYGQPAVQPGVLLSAEQLPDLIRYSVAINNQTQSALDNLQVSVQLPDDAVFDHALETPSFTQFQAPAGQTLTWKSASFAPNDVIDAYTFFLAQPASGAFTVDATWGGENAGEIQSQIRPVVQAATEVEADVTVDSATLAQGVVPVGNTGVVIQAASGDIPANTRVHVRVLGADSNPTASVSDLWWCSMVEVDGLPAGAGLLLQVPVREPLPPQASVQLFGQTGSQWTALPDDAQVSADGQSIVYVHHGGVVAAGTSFSNQPLPAGATASFLAGGSPAARQLQGAKILLAFEQAQLAQLMVQPARCPPGDCAGLQPCFSSVLVAGTVCANAYVRSQDVNARGQAGRTLCRPGGGPCTGFVGLLPGQVSAPPGHGTLCTFVGFTQPTTGLTCSQF